MKITTWVVAALIFALPTISPAAQYTVTDLGPGIALDINSSGEVVGDNLVYSNGVIQYIPVSRAVPAGINDSGQVVGRVAILNPEFGQFVAHPILYSDGVVHDLGTLPGGLGGAAAKINNLGQVVGVASKPMGPHPFLYSDGAMHDLGTLGGVSGIAYDINNRGQVVGDGDTPNQRHAFLYNDGVMHDIGTLAGPGASSTARGINDNGLVVGWSLTNAFDGGRHAFLYDGSMHDLGTLEGGTSRAWGVNFSGQVVGDSDNNNTPDLTYTHAFLYSGGTMRDLNTLIDPSSGWIVDTARGINDSGQIAGSGFRVGDEFTRYAFVLTPIPEPSSFVLAALGLIGLAVWRRRKR